MQKYLSFLVISTFLYGCGTNKTYNITSEPSGAVVSSGSVVYGTTPFKTDLNTILPNRQWDLKPSASRMLKFTKDGYLPGSYVINEFGEGGDVHVNLMKSSSSNNDNYLSPKERLEKLQELRNNSLITNTEYEQKKSEILNEL